MGLGIAQVAHPGAKITEFPLGPWKARLVDLTLDSAYLPTGEVLTATARGWKALIGAIEITPFSNAAGTLSVAGRVKPTTAQTSLTFQAYTAAAGATPLPEAGAIDLSLYTGRYLVLGY
jgi:hypothetical protein